MQYRKIPASLIPDNYYPLLYNGFNGSYIYTYDDTIESLILHPRIGNGYNMDISIYASNHSGNIPLFKNGKKVWISRYDIIEQNEKYMKSIDNYINMECSKLRKQRLGMGE